MKTIRIILLGFILSLMAGHLSAQQRILLDKPVRAGQLILFPELGNESNYRYLPDKPQLAKHPNGDPQLSFLRYVKNEATDAGSNSGMGESAFGGGIVHALVELSVSQDMIREAERALRRIDGNGKIIGPVVFKSGTVALVSSVAQENGQFTEQIVGLGSAPVLENQKSAVSVQLNKLGSKILWESFNTPTADFSFQFEMEVEGYQSPKRVLIEADFERIYKHQTFEAAATTPVLAAEIKIALDELFDSGAIKVTQIGEDEQLDKLRETAYNQLINLMLDKIGGTGVPQLNEILPNNEKSMLDRATEMLANARKEAREANARLDEREERRRERENIARNRAQPRANQARNRRGLPPIEGPQGDQNQGGDNDSDNDENNEERAEREAIPSLAVAVSYRMKQIKRRGTYRIDLNKYTETTRTMPFAYNPGDVRRQCQDCFREVNLDDPLMKQREINASLGGINADDFSKYINFVNVIMKKEHQNGQETLGEVKIDRSQFNQTGNFFKMVYGYKGDDNRTEWLNYQYRTMWSFSGGYQVETDWQDGTFGSIALEPPMVKKPVYIEADEDFMLDEEIRSVEIRLITRNGDKETVTKTDLTTRSNEFTRTVEILLPRDVENYEYEITYFVKGKSPRTSPRQSTDFGRIYVESFL